MLFVTLDSYLAGFPSGPNFGPGVRVGSVRVEVRDHRGRPGSGGTVSGLTEGRNYSPRRLRGGA